MYCITKLQANNYQVFNRAQISVGDNLPSTMNILRKERVHSIEKSGIVSIGMAHQVETNGMRKKK